jgi:hypothetical protein
LSAIEPAEKGSAAEISCRASGFICPAPDEEVETSYHQQPNQPQGTLFQLFT